MRRIIVTDRVRQSIDRSFFGELFDAEVFTAYSNADALRIHRKEKADLIITELYGSGQNGRQFCAEVRDDAALRHVSIILLCRDNDVELQEAARCRANAVLTLPLRGSVLRWKAAELLDIPSRSIFQTRFSARTPSTVIDCRAENISVSGMLITADAELRRGDLLQYSLALDPPRSFALQAEVVRNDRNRYGVRFAGLDPAARQAIEVLVNRNASAR